MIWRYGLQGLMTCSRWWQTGFRGLSRGCRPGRTCGVLLAPLAGKNGWTLAEAAGNKTPDKMQRLLNRAAWDDSGVRDDVRGYVMRHSGRRLDGVLVVDETGFIKKGTRSAAGCSGSTHGHRRAGLEPSSLCGVFLVLIASPKAVF